MHKEYLEQALQKMQEDLFYCIKNRRVVEGVAPTRPPIRRDGLEAKDSLVTSKKFIDQIHQAVKKSFLEINQDLIITPPLGKTKPELKAQGFIKGKDQDITIHLRNKSDDDLPLLINVRSQMSSLEKNYDTILERAFAENVNLRFEKNYVLGEVFLIPQKELDEQACKRNEVKFKNKLVNFNKYFNSYNKVNNRPNLDQSKDNFWKYDKVCVLVVDFEKIPPKLVTDFNNDELNREYQSLSFEEFAPTILRLYKKTINAD